MTRTSLDDAQWTSLMQVMQHIPHFRKRDEAALDLPNRRAVARPA